MVLNKDVTKVQMEKETGGEMGQETAMKIAPAPRTPRKMVLSRPRHGKGRKLRPLRR